MFMNAVFLSLLYRFHGEPVVTGSVQAGSGGHQLRSVQGAEFPPQCQGLLQSTELFHWRGSYTHAHICTHAHMHTYTCAHARMHTCMHTHTHTHTTHTHTHTFINAYTHIHKHMHARTHARTHTRTHSHTLSLMHAHTHAHTHTHKHIIYPSICLFA